MKRMILGYLVRSLVFSSRHVRRDLKEGIFLISRLELSMVGDRILRLCLHSYHHVQNGYEAE
jgi:hypothetical protein